MSKFFNTSRSSVSATIGSDVAVFPPKQWTMLPDGIGLSASLKSLLDQGVLIPATVPTVLRAAKASKPRPGTAPAKKPQKIEVKVDPPKAEVAKPKEAPAPAPTTDKK